MTVTHSARLTALHVIVTPALLHVLEALHPVCWSVHLIACNPTVPANQMRVEMTEELGHAGCFIERILFLGGDPVLEASKTPKRSETLEEMFGADLKEEKGAIVSYTSVAKAADDHRDIGTRMLFEGIVMDKEGHMDWLDRQLGLLGRMGEPTYMAKNMSAAASGG